MIRVLIVILVATCALLAAADGVTVSLRAEAVVSAEVATIGDVAEIETSSPELQAAVAAMPVQELPDLSTRTVDATTVRAVVRHRWPDQMVSVHGECRLSRASSIITADELNAAAQAIVREKYPTADIAMVRSAGPVTVIGGTAPDLVAESLGAVGSVDSPYRIRVLRNGRELGRTLVVLRVVVKTEQVVAARAITKGSTIDIADLRVERLPLRSGTEPIVKPEAIAGSLARIDIAEGTVIPIRSVKTRPAVNGGQPVSLVYVHGDFSLSAPATAMADAAIGEKVNVRRDTDNKLILATVVNPGVVEIRP